jgi:hypothetical protein
MGSPSFYGFVPNRANPPVGWNVVMLPLFRGLPITPATRRILMLSPEELTTYCFHLLLSFYTGN